jgi:hypothetical protein
MKAWRVCTNDNDECEWIHAETRGKARFGGAALFGYHGEEAFALSVQRRPALDDAPITDRRLLELNECAYFYCRGCNKTLYPFDGEAFSISGDDQEIPAVFDDGGGLYCSDECRDKP